MPTTVTITGTGTPIMTAGRAGPGVCVAHGDTVVQVDCGRGTTLRLTEAGVDLTRLSALLVTHHHSDHLVGLADLLMSRWLEAPVDPALDPLPIIAPYGPAATIAGRVLDAWAEEIAMRVGHIGYRSRPDPDIRAFSPEAEPTTVLELEGVVVEAVTVRHEPVVPAVGYRLTTPDGRVVVSGDTAVCPEMERLAGGADVLVHEAFRSRAVEGLLSDPEAIGAYHADTVALGALAARAGVDTLILTHLIPPPATEQDEAPFVEEVRRGGFEGRVIVAGDLDSVTVPAPSPR
jgi:ribonuclease Z